MQNSIKTPVYIVITKIANDIDNSINDYVAVFGNIEDAKYYYNKIKKRPITIACDLYKSYKISK